MADASTEAQSHAKPPIDPATREAEIVGKPQRLPALEPHEFDADARELGDSLNASGGKPKGSPIAPVFRLFFRHANLFRKTMDLTHHLMGQGKLSPRERELAIIRTTWICGAPYPCGEHIELGRALGFTEEELRRLTIGSAAEGWSDHERNLLTAVEQLCERQAISDEVWDSLAKVWTDKQQIEFPAVVGQYIASAIMHNSLRTRLSERNKGLTQLAK
jgi:4-carboxymuconolactone decarboxylase